jgi:pilus assembly protein Flp/PilA
MLQLALKVYGKARKFVTGNEGASLVEYGLLVGLIACACIVAVTLLGTNISALFNRIAGDLTPVAP